MALVKQDFFQRVTMGVGDAFADQRLEFGFIANEVRARLVSGVGPVPVSFDGVDTHGEIESGEDEELEWTRTSRSQFHLSSVAGAQVIDVRAWST